MNEWWKKAVGYQIYIRSFKDSNNDGIGDIKGIDEKLDYLSFLGVNLIWICPFNDSPMDDNGYDVRNYYDVSSDYGTMDDIKTLITHAHQKKIKVMMDLVLNHTSDEHPWFRDAKNDKNSKYHDYYIWKEPRFINGKRTEPTNWASFFGGSCWEYNEKTNEYYLKIFSKKMPDLNWKNPLLREEFQKITSFWIDLGIDGFRVDAVAHLGKDEFVDSNIICNEKYKPDWSKFSNLPIVHDILRELNEKVFSKHNIVTVGEIGGLASINDAIKYSSPNSKELNMLFNFDHNWCNNGWNRGKGEELKINVLHMKEIFSKWQEQMYGKGWNAIYWLNHDQPRVATHYGNAQYQLESNKMLATIMYFMSGTPFIYNGEEIGMTNPEFKSIDDFNDVSIKNQYNIEKINEKNNSEEFIRRVSYSTRDNARTIMQWNDSLWGGFSKSKPWFLLNENYKEINVEDEMKDSNSLLLFYKKIIDIRLNSEYSDIICFGNYQQYLSKDERIYCYSRNYKDNTVLVIANLTKEETRVKNITYKIKKVILHNYLKNNIDILKPFEAVVLEVDDVEEI